MLKEQRPPKKRREPIDYPEGEGGREVCNLETKRGREVYLDRKNEMWKRQNYVCAICLRWPYLATFDHEGGRGAGKRDDRIFVDGQWKNAALCVTCQGIKGSKRYAWVNGTYTPVTKFQEVA